MGQAHDPLLTTIFSPTVSLVVEGSSLPAIGLDLGYKLLSLVLQAEILSALIHGPDSYEYQSRKKYEDHLAMHRPVVQS